MHEYLFLLTGTRTVDYEQRRYNMSDASGPSSGKLDPSSNGKAPPDASVPSMSQAQENNKPSAEEPAENSANEEVIKEVAQKLLVPS